MKLLILAVFGAAFVHGQSQGPRPIVGLDVAINHQAQSLSICSMISPPKQLKTSVNYAWELQVLAMLDPFFTELSLDLCSREEILNVEMELEADQFMVANSKMKISSENMTKKG